MRLNKSEAWKLKWRDPEYRRRQSIARSKASKRRWADPVSRARWTAAMKNNRWKPSKGALRLHKVLGRGWKLEYSIGCGLDGHKKFGLPRTFYVDLAYPEMKLAIEVDGQSHLKPLQIIRDRMRDQCLKELGWSVFRVSEEGCRLI